MGYFQYKKGFGNWEKFPNNSVKKVDGVPKQSPFQTNGVRLKSFQYFQNHPDMVIALTLGAEMEMDESPNLTDTSNSESSEVGRMMKIEQIYKF